MPFVPPWSGMHPLVVHFPIVLLLVAPVFLGLAIFRREPTGPYVVSAWFLLVSGMVGTWVATMSGEAAANLVVASDQIRQAVEHHSDLGEYARDAATLVTLVLSAHLGWVLILKKPLSARLSLGLLGAVFIGSLAGAVLVGMTGHAGAYLVHGLGVTNIASFPPSVP